MSVRMSEAEFARIVGKKTDISSKQGKSKYKARKIKENGVWYDSIGEYERHCYLQLLQKAGDISDLRFHDKSDTIILIDDPVVKYYPDFCYDENGHHVVEDFKGVQTKEFVLKKKMIISKIKKGELDITFRIVKKDDGYRVVEEYDASVLKKQQ